MRRGARARAMATAKKRGKDDGLHDPKFPNLTALHRQDHEDHVRAGMRAGLSRKDAERHADEEEREDVG